MPHGIVAYNIFQNNYFQENLKVLCITKIPSAKDRRASQSTKKQVCTAQFVHSRTLHKVLNFMIIKYSYPESADRRSSSEGSWSELCPGNVTVPPLGKRMSCCTHCRLCICPLHRQYLSAKQNTGH